jgi:uncharacterized protein (DUF111 family)
LEQLDEVLDRFFKDTPTIGVRYWPVGRTRMHRETKEGQLVVDGISLPPKIKISRLGEIIRGKAEADDIEKHLYGTSEIKAKSAGRQRGFQGFSCLWKMRPSLP